MSFMRRTFILGVLAIAATMPAAAQRGGVPPTRPGQGKPAASAKVPAAKADTTKKAPPAVALDFQDQELRTVLDAIAAAGELNVSLANIPSERVTLHMGKPIPRDQMVDVLKGVAEAHGLKYTPTPTLIQIAGTPVEPPNRMTPAQMLAQQIAQANQQQQIRLFTYRLKHASAVQLAPVLTNLFTGATTGRGAFGQTLIPNPNGNGFTVINGQNQGNFSNITPPFQNNGRGGRGAAANNALNNALAQAAGLSSQSGDIRIIAEESSNSLLVRSTDSDWALIQQIIQGVDLRPLQVLIEVTIAEVQRTHDLDLGVSGSAKKVTNNGRNSGTVSLNQPANTNSTSARDFVLELSGNNGTVSYDVAIAALQERGDVRVLSLPVIIAQNNRQAVLNVGSSRPFVQVSQTVPNDPTGRVQTVQYIDVGTVLTITPTINPDGYVNLQVQQTDNSATNEVQFDAPVINKREATTQIFLRDGQTTVIGGLADNTNSSDVAGIPFLSKIPLIGPLIFGRTTKSTATNELFLFLTPHIISTDEDIDKLRNAVKGTSDLLKDVNINPRIVPPADTVNLIRGRDTTRVRPPNDSLTKLRVRPPVDGSPQGKEGSSFSVVKGVPPLRSLALAPVGTTP